MFLIYITFPDQDSAEKTCMPLIQDDLAKCLHISQPGKSIYKWEGKLEIDNEVIAFLKCSKENYPAIEKYIETHHPYDVPCIVCIEPNTTLDSYLDWVLSK